MPDNIAKEDLRKTKTDKALKAALLMLLSYRDFNQITVNDLCKEALVSRAAFYSHFTDKYDLLRAWLADVKAQIIKDVYQYEELESAVNRFIYENRKIIKNILQYANSEILEIVQGFMSAIVEQSVKRKLGGATGPNHTILFNFCVGGLVQLLLWQVKNNFPVDIKMVNDYLYRMLGCVMKWDEKQ